MSTKTGKTQVLPDPAALIEKQYGCGPVHFAGTSEALYERHLLFDSGVDLDAATARDRFEALARSVRDILSQRWLLTEKTYEQQNPKRIYYLSMEFLIGRSLQNNVTNLLLAPVSHQVIEEKKLNLLEILEQEPDAGLGNGGLGRLAACFVESAATMQLPAKGYGLRYEYGILNVAGSGKFPATAPSPNMRTKSGMCRRAQCRKTGKCRYQGRQLRRVSC